MKVRWDPPAKVMIRSWLNSLIHTETVGGVFAVHHKPLLFKAFHDDFYLANQSNCERPPSG